MSKTAPPSRTADQFIVRFPDGMRDQIAEAAKAAGRSMNAEIVQRLDASLSGASPANEELLTSHRTLADALVRYLTEPGAQAPKSPALLDLAKQLRGAIAAVERLSSPQR